MASLKYWLWLTTRKGLRPEHAVRLLEHFGTPEGAYFADPGEYDLLSDLPLPVRTALQEKHLAEAEASWPTASASACASSRWETPTIRTGSRISTIRPPSSM